MTPEDLESAGLELFGENWKGLIADALGVDLSTRWRMFKRNKLPGPVVATVSSWLYLYRTFHILPPERPQEVFRSKITGDVTPNSSPYTAKIEDLALYIFGEHWRSALSSRLGVNASTLWRQITTGDIPSPTFTAIRAWQLIYVLTGSIPDFQEIEATPPISSRTRSSKYSKLLNED